MAGFNFEQLSRGHYSYKNPAQANKPDDTHLIIGCLQRIATALEDGRKISALKNKHALRQAKALERLADVAEQFLAAAKRAQ